MVLWDPMHIWHLGTGRSVGAAAIIRFCNRRFTGNSYCSGVISSDARQHFANLSLKLACLASFRPCFAHPFVTGACSIQEMVPLAKGLSIH